MCNISSTCTCAGTQNYIWSTWASGTAATTYSISSGTIWTAWNTTSSTTYVQYPIAPRQQAAEEFEAQRERQRIAREEAIARRQERFAAEQAAEFRARELLVANLTPEQRAEFEAGGSFVVVGSKTGKTYRIRKGWENNVRSPEEDGTDTVYCIHPGIRVPEHDNMLTQKLLLELNEEAFLKEAVTYRGQRAA
jgi:hypothetical protein